MTTVLRWLSEQPLHERPRWSSQRPPVAPTFALESLDAATPSALAFTRATACSGTDYQGNVFQALSGEMTRQGLRRVRNLFSASTTLSTQGVTVEVGAVYVVSFYGTGSITFTGAATGSLSGTGATTRVSTTVTATTTTLTCTVAGSVTSAQCQRARPGQTTPDEYVSVGVLSAPYHDGVGADGIRYFNTDENGARIDGTRGYRRIDNLCTYSDSSFGSWYTRTGLETNSTTLIPSTSNSPHYLGTPSLAPANSSTWLKFLFRSSGATWLRIGHGGHAISVNSVTGAVGATSGSGTTTVTGPDDDGFYTLIDKVSAHSSAVGVYFSVNNVDSTTTQTYAGDGVSGIEIRHAQLSTVEGAESEPPVYIQTAASAVSQWVASSDVTPIPPGLVIGSAQTNRITYSSTLTSWSTTGSPTVTAGYDAQVGAYTRLDGLGAAGVTDVYLATSGFTGSARTEIALMLKAGGTGTLRIMNPQGLAYGQWDLDRSLLSTTRHELVNRFHPAVTITTEFTATAGGASGVQICRGDAGSHNNVSVSWVTQVEDTRCYRPILSAGSVTAANADAPSFTWTAFASNNEGAIVLDFVPLAPDATAASYASGAAFVGKSTSAAMTASDGTNSGAWGDQTERTRTKIALAWQAGSGMTGYRDGEEAFADATYDGAWATSTLTLAGPMILRELSIYPTALTATQLQALSNG